MHDAMKLRGQNRDAAVMCGVRNDVLTLGFCEIEFFVGFPRTVEFVFFGTHTTVLLVELERNMGTKLQNESILTMATSFTGFNCCSNQEQRYNYSRKFYSTQAIDSTERALRHTAPSWL